MSNPEQFLLPRSLYDQLCKHALETKDKEVCGLLAEDQAAVCSLYRIPNIAEEPETTFFMDPQSQIAALRTMRQYRESLCAIYHSHPHSEAIPSDRDRNMAAYPGTTYLILSLLGDEPELRAYFFDGDDFLPMQLIVTD